MIVSATLSSCPTTEHSSDEQFKDLGTSSLDETPWRSMKQAAAGAALADPKPHDKALSNENSIAPEPPTVTPGTPTSVVDSRALCSPPSYAPISPNTKKHFVLQSGAVHTSSNSTASALLSDEFLIQEGTMNEKEMTEAGISPKEGREVVARLELPSHLPFFYSTDTIDSSKCFESFGASLHHLPSDSGMHDVSTSKASVSNADEIMTSAPETPVTKTRSESRHEVRYEIGRYKARAVKKRKLTVAEMAAAELDAERRIPSNLPHRDGEHVTIWNKHEQRKIAGNAAPLRQNLKTYLMGRPQCEVYTDQKPEARSSEENGGIHDGTVRTEKHVSLWHKYKKRKLAGNAAPLERNLKDYLKFHPEYEVYTIQDTIFEQSIHNDVDQPQENVSDVDNELDKVGTEDDEEGRIEVEYPAMAYQAEVLKIREDDSSEIIVSNLDATRKGSNAPQNSTSGRQSSTQHSDIDMFLSTTNFSIDLGDLNDADPIIAAFLSDIGLGIDV